LVKENFNMTSPRNTPNRQPPINHNVIEIDPSDPRNNSKYLREHPNVHVVPGLNHRRHLEHLAHLAHNHGSTRHPPARTAGAAHSSPTPPATAPATPTSHSTAPATATPPSDPAVAPDDQLLDDPVENDDQQNFYFAEASSEGYDPQTDDNNYGQLLPNNVIDGASSESIPSTTTPNQIYVDPYSWVLQKDAVDGSVTFKCSIVYDIPDYMGDFDIIKTLVS